MEIRRVIDLDEADTKVKVTSKDISDMNVRDVQEVVAMQAGVSKTADGLQIRGARVYETLYLVDNVTAQDPLAGTGFGVEVASGSIGEMELTTGGSGAEYGDGSAGVISTTIKEGGDKFQIAGSWQSDHVGIYDGKCTMAIRYSRHQHGWQHPRYEEETNVFHQLHHANE